MEGNLSEGGKEQAVLEFMDIVGETAERARQYLQVLNFASFRIGPLVLVLLTFSFSQGELID